MRLISVEIENFGCYRGKHVLTLKDIAYAIVARTDKDPARSNWGGKSTLVETLPFVLFGTHRHRLEDDWITDGEERGSVVFTFDDGTKVGRSRTRGKKTEFELIRGEKKLTQGDAQSEIERFLGVDEDGFLASSFFKQREMARLILARPEERMGVISSWLRLEPFSDAESIARAKAKANDTEVSSTRAQIETLNAQLDTFNDWLARFEGEGGMAALLEREEILRSEIVDIDDMLGTLQGDIGHAAAKLDEYARTLARGSELSARYAALPGVDLEAVAECESEHADLTAAVARLREKANAVDKVFRGQFDGLCPVLEGFECPAKKTINQLGASNAEAHKEAHEAFSAKHAEMRELSGEISKARALISERQAYEAKLDEARHIIAMIKGDLPKFHALVAKRPEVEQHIQSRSRKREELNLCLGEKQTAASMALSVRDYTAKVMNLSESIREKSNLVARYREAAVIFGRNGAQRRIAETALAHIEEQANEMLSAAGIDLTLKVQWSREGGGLAKHCEACGHPFPTSTKVKNCEKCGTARGDAVVNKLEVVLSDTSGAAEDLAGIALQLAGAAYLRAEGRSRVEFVVLDEPGAQCDRANRRALTAALPKMLAVSGIRQAFVISHTSDLTDSLPGRIEIVNTGGNAVPTVKD